MTKARFAADFGWRGPVNLRSRAELVGYIDRNGADDGQLYSDGRLFYIGQTGATAIADLPGLVPGLEVTPDHMGAGGNGATIDTAAVQAAADYAASIGGKVTGAPGKVYRVAAAGTHTSGRSYCIMLASGVTLEDLPLVYERTNADTDIVITPDVGNVTALVTKDIALRRVTVNGNADMTTTGNGFNFWLRKVRNLTVDHARSVDSTNWGIRIEQCDEVHVTMPVASHEPDVNADGVHYIDCRNVSQIGGNLHSQGDDTLIVEALDYDVFNINISGVVCRAPTAGIAGGRGVLVFRETFGGRTAVLKMENIRIQGTCMDCWGPALAVETPYCEFTNNTLDITAKNCGYGAVINAGGAAGPGTVRGNSFNVQSADSGTVGFFTSIFSGSTMEDNAGNVLVSNPGDGQVGISLKGDRWSGRFVCDYDPKAQKTAFSVGVDLTVTQSTIFVQGEDAGRNIRLNDGCAGNQIMLGDLRGAATHDIEILGSAGDTIFIGGAIAGTVSGATNDTQFIGSRGQAKVLTQGAFGIGSTQPQTVTNVDDATLATGVYRTGTTTSSGTLPANATLGAFSGSGPLLNMRHDTGSVTQWWSSLSDAQIWTRRYSAGAWSGWQRASRILGTVAQVGAAATGAAFESAISGGYRYYRNAAGQQTVEGTITTSASGEVTVTFPTAVPFVGVPLVTFGVVSAANQSLTPRAASKSATSMTVSCFDDTNARVATSVDFTASGRWF